MTTVVLPTSLSGLVTGALLAIARGAGETAPLLFTAFGAQVATDCFLVTVHRRRPPAFRSM